jgi:hypothetical protein
VRPPRLLTAAATALCAVLVACSAPEPAEPPPAELERPIELTGDWEWTRQDGPLELGVTHTQRSLDPSAPAAARERGTAILSDNSAIWQNHHLMGFGTMSPQPSPDEYDWESLDRRMELTVDTGGRTMLTLCCAPDWMKGGEAGETDWDRLEEAPLAEHFDDYARLAAEAVRRYPQVERVQVWNELKGFWDDGLGRWGYEAYTDLYNRVYTAVKQARPEVLVGGPYVVLISLDPGSEDGADVAGPWGVADQRTLDVVEYWLAHNVGADFIVVDGSTSTRQDTIPAPFDGAQKYADLTRWIRERTDLPVWWAEFYPDVPEGEPAGPSSPASAAVTLAAVAAYARSGASGALLWGPQGHDLDIAALWTDSTQEDGGRPTPLTAAWQWLVPRLAEGTVEIGRNATLPLLAFRSGASALVVNLSDTPLNVSPGTPLEPWAIALANGDS